MTEKEWEEALEGPDTLTIFTLMVRCPTGGVPNDSCPFAQHRDQHTLEEKFRLAESLPPNKRKEMLAFHRHCQSRKHLMLSMADKTE